MIPPTAQHNFAKLMNATTISINASHASYVSHPDEIAKLIIDAVKGTSKQFGGFHSHSIEHNGFPTKLILAFFGGLFLIVGLIVPVVGLFFAIFMIVNVIMKKRKMNAAYNDPSKASYEIDIRHLIRSIVVIILGAGAFSVDSIIGLR